MEFISVYFCGGLTILMCGLGGIDLLLLL